MLLDPDAGQVVILSCEAEIAASYTHHSPVPGQFSLAVPYQASAPQPLHAPLTPGLSETVPDLSVSTTSDKDNKRKRKRAYQPNSRVRCEQASSVEA